MYVPGVFIGLINDWEALEKWKDINYLLYHIGKEMVEGIHYNSEYPFRNFIGGD
jgi:hypothetical protein